MSDLQNCDSPCPVIGQLAIKHGLVTQEAIDLAWKTCSKAREPFTAFADYLLSNKLISTLEMQRLMTAARVVEIRKKEVKFGTIAVEKGYLSISLLKLALDEQKQEMIQNKRTKLLGDILVEAGMITTGQRNEVLKEQNRLKTTNQINSEQTIPTQGSSNTSEPSTDIQHLTTDIPIERGITLTVGHEAFDAFISKTDHFDRTITTREIKDALAGHQIVFGLIDETEIDDFIKSKDAEVTPLRVARGVRPRQGNDAAVKYHFKTHRLEIGKINQKGNMDFRQRGEIPRVAVNDILAEKTPPAQGVDGTNVFGETITVAPALDIKMKYDRGAQLSRDGLKILAGIDGEPRLSWAGIISVLDEFTTDSVDYETGHIEYPGNIMVKRCIHDGFKVSGKNIKAGEVDGGIIHADGDLCVANGITNAVIYSMGAVSAKFIQKSTIRCLGDIHTDKEIVDSTIETGGACVINQGKIIASIITAKMGLYTGDIGTERSKPALLKVGEDIFILKEIERFKQEITRVRQGLVDARGKKTEWESKIDAEHENSSKLAHMEESSMAIQKETIVGISSLTQSGNQEKLHSMRARLQALKKKDASIQQALDQSLENVEHATRQLKEISSSIQTHEERLQDLIQERDNLKEWSGQIPGIARVNVSQTLKAGTKITGCHSELTIKETRQGADIREILKPTSDKDRNSSRWEMQITPG